MLLEKINALRRETAFRFSFWYAFIMIGLFTLCFMLFFPYAVHNVQHRTDKEIRSGINELVNIFKSEGQKGLEEEFSWQAHALGAGNICQSLLDFSGRVLLTSDILHWKDLPVDMELLKRATGQSEPVFATISVPGFHSMVRVAYARLGKDRTLRMALLLRQDENFLFGLQRALIVTMAVILAGVVLAGWMMLQRAIGRVVTVTNTAFSISSRSLDKRVPVSRRGDELDRLAQAFNGMLDRIGCLVKGQQEVTDNVAHDLKMPLARIRVLAESVLTTPREKEDLEEVMSTIIEESDRLLEMINTTLEIKAIEAGSAVLNLAEVNLADVIRQAVDLFQFVAEDKDLTLQVNHLVPFIVYGDLRRLQRVFANLIDNAVKYTPAGGKVEVTMRTGEHEAAVDIADTGIGISPESMPRIFERFYRGDKSRSTSGLGLGLSLAESIIKAHGGKISVQSSSGRGSTFTIILQGKPS
jgi:heavy metal sensor kinase